MALRRHKSVGLCSEGTPFFSFSGWPLNRYPHSGFRPVTTLEFYCAQPAQHHTLMFFHSKACRTFNYMHQYQTNLDSNYDRIDLKVDLEAVQARRQDLARTLTTSQFVAYFHQTGHFIFEHLRGFPPFKVHLPKLWDFSMSFPVFPHGFPWLFPSFSPPKIPRRGREAPGAEAHRGSACQRPGAADRGGVQAAAQGAVLPVEERVDRGGFARIIW